MASLATFFSIAGPKGGIKALDGLRAIAVLLVLVRHGFYPIKAESGEALPALLVNGWVGVDLFFALSGFLITTHLLRSEAKGGVKLGSYFLKRGLRIMPTYWFVLALVVLGAIPLYTISTEDLGWRVIYHALVLQDYLPSDIVVAFWSLGVEEKFYALAPLMLGLVLWKPGLRGRFVVIGAAMLVSVLARAMLAGSITDPLSYDSFFPLFRSPFHHCMDALGAGMLAGLLFHEVKAGRLVVPKRQADLLFWSGALVVTGLVASHDMMARIGWWDMVLQPLVIALCFGAMVAGASLGGGPQKLLSIRPGIFFARISYPLYLIHMPLIPLCWALGGSHPEQGLAAAGSFLILYGGLSVFMACVIHWLVEKPSLLLKDRVGARPLDFKARTA